MSKAMTSVDDAYRYCRAIAHKHGANFSVGFRFLPRAKRRAVYAAYAFCRRRSAPSSALNLVRRRRYRGDDDPS